VTERGGEQPVDLAQIRADDALLDALGRGAPAPGDDDLAGLLAEWRADLDTDITDITDIPVDPPTAAPAGGRSGTGRRRALAGAVAAAVLLGGATLGANRSGPDNPLWPLTKVLYPGLAHEREAEHAIATAREAAAAGQYDRARGLLDDATGQAGQVDDPATRQRLLDRIAEVRRSLPQAPGPAAPTGPPSATPAPAPGGTAGPSPGATTPGPVPGGGGGATGGPGNVPGLPLPTQIRPPVSPPALPLPLPLPTPTLTLPTSLLPPLLP
jgi:hypothetical protein